MRAGFAFADFSLAQQPADVGVIGGELFNFRFSAGEMINPAVSDMAEIHAAGGKPAQAHGGLHAGAFVVAGAEIRQRPVDFAIQLLKRIFEALVEAGGGRLEGTRQQQGDFLHGNLAGIFAGLRAAHAVAHGKGKIVFGRGRLACLAEPVRLPRVKAQAQE